MDSTFVITTLGGLVALLRLPYVRLQWPSLNTEGQAVLAATFGLAVAGVYSVMIGVEEMVDCGHPASTVTWLVLGGAAAAYAGGKCLPPLITDGSVFRRIEPIGPTSAVAGRAALIAQYGRLQAERAQARPEPPAVVIPAPRTPGHTKPADHLGSAPGPEVDSTMRP